MLGGFSSADARFDIYNLEEVTDCDNSYNESENNPYLQFSKDLDLSEISDKLPFEEVLNIFKKS